MRLLKPVPDLGPCEGRWITAFGTPRGCSYRASESYDSPCGHVHRLCATCVYALEQRMGTWDETEDILRFGLASGHVGMQESDGLGVRESPARGTLGEIQVPRHAAARRHAGRVPLHLAFAGIGALAALMIVGLPNLVAAAPLAVGTAVLLYLLALRYG